MRIAEVDIRIVPGLGDSAPEHWQRRWAGRFSTGAVIEQDEWHRPDRERWVQTIVAEVAAAQKPVVLIAHSLGVSALVHAAPYLPEGKVIGALLVSPPDHESDALPKAARAFDDVPRDPLPFPSLLVASSDDPLVSVDRAADLANAWGSELHIAQNAGHINVASGHGPWPEGLMLFTRLMQRI